MFIRTKHGGIINVNNVELISINLGDPCEVEIASSIDDCPISLFQGSEDSCIKVLDFIWQQIKLERKTADVGKFIRRMENKNKQKLQLSKEELQREKDIKMLEQIVNDTIKNLRFQGGKI